MASRYSARDLFQLPPTNPSNWIVDGLLRTHRKRPSLLCGFPESGKSTLAHQLALAVAHGIPFLGRETAQGHVIYWKNEDSAQDVSEDFLRAGLREDSDLSILLPKSGDNNFKELTAELLQCPKTKLVIIETLSDFLPVTDITSNDDCRAGLDQFCNRIIDPHPDCAYLILHHFNKSSMNADLSSIRVLGGTTIVGGTDAKIFLEQVSDQDQRRIIHASVRKGRRIEPTYLNFDPETLTATLGESVRQESILNRSVIKVQKGLDLDGRIVQFVGQNSGSPKWQIVALLGGNNKSVGNRIDDLIHAGTVVASLGGEKGNAQLLSLPNRDLLAAMPSHTAVIQ
jgi:hypothetical protein